MEVVGGILGVHQVNCPNRGRWTWGFSFDVLVRVGEAVEKRDNVGAEGSRAGGVIHGMPCDAFERGAR
jgi:hypothetical protein